MVYRCRRGKPESGDIDVLATHPSLKLGETKKKHGETMLKRLVDYLKGLVIDVISMGDTKFMVNSLRVLKVQMYLIKKLTQ